MKKLTRGLDEKNKQLATAVSDEMKDKIRSEKQKSTIGLKTCNNILAMAQPLHEKAPSFMGNKRINLSWKESTMSSATTGTTRAGKRPSASTVNGSSSNMANKGRGAGGFHNAFQNFSYGGRSGGRSRGRGQGGRGRGRGYW